MPPTTISSVFPASITILLGHAGTGKTNTSLGIALALAAEGFSTTLADLDVVNPYFRSSDYPELLAEAGIRLIAPVLARTTLDTPSLTGELDAVIARASQDPNSRLVIDVGGDDDGATTIGRWSKQLTEAKSDVLYVVSAYRALTTSAEEAAALLPDIEAHAHLVATGLLNASNLGDETELEHVMHGRQFAARAAALLGLPLRATVVPAVAIGGVGECARVLEAGEAGIEDREVEPLVRVPRLVKLPW